MSNRLKNTKIVTFKEDYKLNGGQVVYAKGSEHPIHKDQVEKLKKNGAKFDAKDFDMSRLDTEKHKFEQETEK